MTFSIRTQLTVVYCALFCASMALVEVGAYFGLTSSINAVVDRELQARVAGVADFLNDHIARFPLPRLQAELKNHLALQPELLAIFETASREIFESPAMRDAPGSRPLRYLSAHRTIRGRRYDLRLATDMTVPAEIGRRFRWVLLLTAPLVLACASFAGYWLSGRALAPVSELTRAARSMGAANLSRRLGVPQSGDEIEELAVTLNGMLARMEDAFRHVTEFTANASHELRTPLAVIRATAEVALLRATGNSDSYREALHRILREAEKNTGLLDSLLHLARADSAARALELKPVNLGESVRQACERMELLAREKNITLRIENGTGPVLIPADSDHLLRLTLILLDNAIKYTPLGGTITAVATIVGKTATLEVRDTGIGIAPADLTGIFKRFYRADEARTHGFGAGLGLSIAKWIVEAHNAEITVISEPGEGSVFRVAFPGIPGDQDREPLRPHTVQIITRSY